MIEENDPHEEPSVTLGRLWQVVKSSETNAKLILPDLLTNPFYLPNPKATKEIKDAQFAKQLRRLNYICERDSKNVHPTNRSSVMASLPVHKLMGKELAIEKRLVDPYRKDTEKREKLLADVAALQAKLNAEQPVVPKEKAKLIVSPRRPSVSVEVRQSLVIHRRTTMLETVQEGLELYAHKMEEKRLKAAVSAQVQNAQITIQRVSRWAQIISVLNGLQVMYNIVSTARKIKAQSPERWKACLKIQKWFRKILVYGRRGFSHVRPSVKVNHILKMLKGAVANNNSLANRQFSCTVITTFLRALQGRMSVMVKKFVSHIKNLQQRLRVHFTINRMRMVLLERLFDVCLPSLLIHMEMVNFGRGHDLGNLTAYDLNKINSVQKSAARYRLVQPMNTANFHAYLRNHSAQIPLVLSIFKIVVGTTRKDVELTKENELFELLQRKRKQHVLNLAAVKVKRLVIPKFSVSHIKVFIHGGEDPLNTILVAAEEEDDRSHMAYEATRQLKVGSLMSRRPPAGTPRACLLLSLIEIEDICMVAMSVAAKSVDQRSLANLRKAVTNSRSTSTSLYSKQLSGSAESNDSDGRPHSGRGVPVRPPSSSRGLDSSGSARAAKSTDNKSSPRRKSFAKVPDISGDKERKGHLIRPATPPRKGSGVVASPQKARRMSKLL